MKPAFIHRESPRHVRPARCLIVLGALSALLLTGCGSGGTTATNSEGRASGGALSQDSAAAKSGTGTKNGAPVAPAEASKSGVVGVGPKLTKSASLDLRVKNIDAAAAQVRTIATGLQAPPSTNEWVL